MEDVKEAEIIEEPVPTTPEPPTPEELAGTDTEFINKYNDLCKETGFEIQAVPQWKRSQDMGTFSLSIALIAVKK